MLHTRELIVAGFHRSGTSFAMSVLSSAGLHVGDDLIGAFPSNPRGHFEDRQIVEFHNDLLADNGRNWQVDEPFIPIVTSLRWGQMRTIIAERRAVPGPWGFKDPRVCLFLPLWKHLIPTLKIVLVYRDHQEVEESLVRRHADGLERGVADPAVHRRFFDDTSLALRMWIVHNEALLDFAALHRGDVLAVSFESLRNGYPLAAEAERRWHLGLEHVDTTAVFDASVTMPTYPRASPLHEGRLEQRADDVASALVTLKHATQRSQEIGS